MVQQSLDHRYFEFLQSADCMADCKAIDVYSEECPEQKWVWRVHVHLMLKCEAAMDRGDEVGMWEAVEADQTLARGCVEVLAGRLAEQSEVFLELRAGQ